MKNNTFLILGFLCLIVLASCSKKEDVILTPQDHLTSAPWIITGFLMFEEGQEPENLFMEMEECERDNLIIFNEDETCNISDGAIKCDDFDISSAIWTYTEALNTVTVIVDQEYATTFKIEKLDAEIFEARMEEDSTTYCIVTFEHPTE